jgi:hypothetical protein
MNKSEDVSMLTISHQLIFAVSLNEIVHELIIDASFLYVKVQLRTTSTGYGDGLVLGIITKRTLKLTFLRFLNF